MTSEKHRWIPRPESLILVAAMVAGTLGWLVWSPLVVVAWLVASAVAVLLIQNLKAERKTSQRLIQALSQAEAERDEERGRREELERELSQQAATAEQLARVRMSCGLAEPRLSALRKRCVRAGPSSRRWLPAPSARTSG